MASTTRQDGNQTTTSDGNVQGVMLFVFYKSIHWEYLFQNQLTFSNIC